MTTRTVRTTLLALATFVAGGWLLAPTISSAATFDQGDTTYVPIVPCRLLDTRPGPNSVGPRTAPVGAGETYTLTATGPQGNCELPATASGIAINVTATNPTDVSWLQMWPADAPQPLSSDLNYVAGQAPTPNQLQVKLSAAGDVNIYNESGTVHVIGDIVGYYTAEGLTELDQRVEALEQAETGSEAICGGLDFLPDESTSGFYVDGSAKVGGQPGDRFSCGLPVPAGATITAFSATIVVTGPMSFTSCRLRSVDASTGDESILATTNSTGPDMGTVIVNADLGEGEVVPAGSLVRADCSLNDELGVIAAVVSYEV